MKPLYIAAGNHQQAVTWAKHWGLAPTEWRYISWSQTLEGTRDVRYAIVGTFYDRSDSRDILGTLKRGNARLVRDEGRATE